MLIAYLRSRGVQCRARGWLQAYLFGSLLSEGVYAGRHMRQLLPADRGEHWQGQDSPGDALRHEQITVAVGKLTKRSLPVDRHWIVALSLNTMSTQMVLKAVAVIALYDKQVVVWNSTNLRRWRSEPFLQCGQVACRSTPAILIPSVQMK